MSVQKCYYYDPRKGKAVVDNSSLPCPALNGDEFTSCCSPGSYCVDDGLCKFDEPAFYAYSRYYVGSCTDPTTNDPNCSQECRRAEYVNIVHTGGQNWVCCGENNAHKDNCVNPLGDKFFAPPPAQLSTLGLIINPSVVASILATAEPSSVKQLSPAAFTSYIQSDVLSASPTPTWFQGMPTEVQSFVLSASGLLPSQTGTGPASPGESAKGGSFQNGSTSNSHLGVEVGVPVGVVVLLVLVGVAAFSLFRRRRQRRRQSRGPQELGAEKPSWAIYKSELPSTEPYHELPTTMAPAELPGDFAPVEVGDRVVPGVHSSVEPGKP